MRLTDFKFYNVPTITLSLKQSSNISTPDEIEIIGDKIDGMRLSNFVPTRGGNTVSKLMWMVAA